MVSVFSKTQIILDDLNRFIEELYFMIMSPRFSEEAFADKLDRFNISETFSYFCSDFYSNADYVTKKVPAFQNFYHSCAILFVSFDSIAKGSMTNHMFVIEPYLAYIDAYEKIVNR